MNYILAENETPFILTAVKNGKSNLPGSFSLSQNYPNPFNPTTMIQYSVPKSGLVTLKIYNMFGQEVAAIVNQQQAGNYNVKFNATRLASGVYMYRIRVSTTSGQSGSFTSTKKTMLVK
jgi:hypothetical protein